MHLHGPILDGKGKTILYFGRLLPAVLTLGVNLVFVSLEGSHCGSLFPLLGTNRRQFLFLSSIGQYVIFVLLLDVGFLLVEGIDDLIHVVTNVAGEGYLVREVHYWGVPSKSEASFLRRVICSLAYWMLLKRSFPFI